MASRLSRPKTASPMNQKRSHCKQLERENTVSNSPVLNVSGLTLKSLKEELTCSICLDICIRPCTTPCGHSFCRQCLRGALVYSSRCPKCRESLVPGFALNVNTVLWNTIQMLFPNTKQAPASPPPPKTMRRVADGERRERLRDVLAVSNVEAGRRSVVDNRIREQSPEEQDDTIPSRYSHHSTMRSSHRRLRMNAAARVMSSSPTGVFLRGRPVQRNLGRNHQGERQFLSSRYITGERTRTGVLESPVLLAESHSPASSRHHPSSLNPSLAGSTLSQEQMSNIREEPFLEALETTELRSPDHGCFPYVDDNHHFAARHYDAHGSGISNPRSSRRTQHSQDLDSEIEYVTLQGVEQLDQQPIHRRQRVYRLENRTRTQVERHPSRRELLLRRIRSVPTIEDRQFDDPDDDFESTSIASVVREEDLEYTPSTTEFERTTPRRSNSFRFTPSSRYASSMSRGSSRERRFAGFEQLIDISSQIEAAMNEIERLSVRPNRSRQPAALSSPTHHQPATPLTHRSCYQLSDDDDDDEVEDAEEEIDWGARLPDAVFLVDDLDSDSSELSQQFDDIDHLSDIVGLNSQNTDDEWISSFDDL